MFSISDNVVAYTEGNLKKYINRLETSQPSMVQDVRSPMNMTILTVQIKNKYIRLKGLHNNTKCTTEIEIKT